jgi:hypothetical protein
MGRAIARPDRGGTFLSLKRTLIVSRYEPAPDKTGFLARIEENGKRTVGRFINRRFQADTPKKA